MLAGPVGPELLQVDGGRPAVGGPRPRVEPLVANGEIDTAVAREVTRHDAIPPTVALFEARRVQADELPAARVVEDCDRHPLDRKSTRLNSSHGYISYAVFCLKKKKNQTITYNKCSPTCLSNG